MKVGFIGLGRMGLPMACSVRRAGFQLTVFNRSPQRVSLLLNEVSVAAAGSPAELLADSDVVITMLSDGDAVQTVMEGTEGLLANPRSGAIVIEMSTIGPERARSFAAELSDRGMTMLDAPVSGSVALAESASLTTLVGGPRSEFDRARPVLAAMTREQLYLGESGAGAAMKLGLNGLIAATNQAIAEALVVAEASGIEPDAAYDAITSSAVGSPFVGYKRDAFLNPSDESVAFTLALMQKDLELYMGLAEKLRVPLAAAPAVRDAIERARVTQGDDADMAAVAQALRTIRGLSGGRVA